MPGGKGDYSEWETNYTPEISDRNLHATGAAAGDGAGSAHRDRLLAGVNAGLEQGAPAQVPERLLA